MQHFLSCKASFMHFLNYIPYYAWVCFLTLAQTKIATLFRRLTGSCQTLKTEQRCQRQFPRERRTLVLLFKNTEDGVFLPGKCCRRCPLLLLHKVAASGETFKKEVNLLHCTADRGWFRMFIFIWSENWLQEMFSQIKVWRKPDQIKWITTENIMNNSNLWPNMVYY